MPIFLKIVILLNEALTLQRYLQFGNIFVGISQGNEHLKYF